MPKNKINKMEGDGDVTSDEESRSSNDEMETNENSEVTRWFLVGNTSRSLSFSG